MTESLLILGASVRAAAQSAGRAGFDVYAADLFGDRDLRSCCQSSVVAQYPGGLAEAAATMPPCPWMYTGGLENHPDLVAEIARARVLYGNSAKVLRAVRNPGNVHQMLTRAGLLVPSLSRSPGGVPKDGSWLRKPYRGCGGAGIHPWSGQGDDENHFFQQRIAGRSVAAVYVALGREVVLLGVTAQLVGCGWSGAPGFAYAGSIGPLPLSAGTRDQFVKIGHVLTGSFGLVGLFGVDAVLADENVWTIEVNPRYTASVEILERSLGCRAVALHARACRGQPFSGSEKTVGNWCGKAIVYAKQDLVIRREFDAEAQIADIPDVGTRISQGRPVLTVLTEAPDESSLMAKLQSRIAEIERFLYSDVPNDSSSPAVPKQPGC